MSGHSTGGGRFAGAAVSCRWLSNWHDDIWGVGAWLERVYQGWLNYFAVPGSVRFVRACRRRVDAHIAPAVPESPLRLERPKRVTEVLWPRASIRHSWPDLRFAVKRSR